MPRVSWEPWRALSRGGTQPDLWTEHKLQPETHTAVSSVPRCPHQPPTPVSELCPLCACAGAQRCVNGALGARGSCAGIGEDLSEEELHQSQGPFPLMTLLPLTMSSCLFLPAPPTPLNHPDIAVIPPHPLCFPNTESWAETSCRMRWGHPLTLAPPSPPPLTCSSWNSRSVRMRWQSRITRSRALAAASRAGSLSRGPTRARRSARALRGSMAQKSWTPTSQPNCLDLSPLRWTLFCGSQG